MGRERESERKKNVPIKIVFLFFLFLITPQNFPAITTKNTHYKDFGESSGRTREKAERDGKKQ